MRIVIAAIGLFALGGGTGGLLMKELQPYMAAPAFVKVSEGAASMAFCDGGPLMLRATPTYSPRLEVECLSDRTPVFTLRYRKGAPDDMAIISNVNSIGGSTVIKSEEYE